MDAVWKGIVDGYMKALYDFHPEDALLDKIRDFEGRLIACAEKNGGNYDVVKVLTDAGLQAEYQQLFIDLTTGNTSSQKAPMEEKKEKVHIPTVSEFIGTYRYVYEQNEPYMEAKSKAAYQDLFDVEKRAADILDAQMIIESEGLITKTLTAAYAEECEAFLEATDPNYEVTSALTKSTIGVYATGKSIDHIEYMGHIARSTSSDVAVQIQAKMNILTFFMTALHGYALSKCKLRMNEPHPEGYITAMIFNRLKVKEYYEFLVKSYGLTFEAMEENPFCRIMLLNPQALDGLARIKKVEDPGNIKAMKYMLFEEILSDKTIEEILMTPQTYPFKLPMDVKGMDEEYIKAAWEYNKDIPYFKEVGPGGDLSDGSEAIRGSMGSLVRKIAARPHETEGKVRSAVSKVEHTAHTVKKSRGLLGRLLK